MNESSGRASEYLTAELTDRKRKGFRSVLAMFETVITGDLNARAPSDLVVRRIDTGREVLRTHADVGDPDYLLHQVRKDLESKTVAEFIAEWRLPD